MNPSIWRLFLEAAELGSLSKVALNHGTSQPHVSRQISELEHSCGGRLFQRTGRGVVLTELGQHIAPRVRNWIVSTDQLENDIQNSAGTPLGRVRLGIIPSVAHPFTSTLIQRLGERFPLVQLRVREGQGSQLETWLEDASLDLAILLRGGKADGRYALSLAETDTYLVGAIGDRITARPTTKFKALNELPMVAFCRPSTWRDQLDHQASQLGIRLNVRLEADSLALQLAIAAQGNAYTLLGASAIAPALAQGRIQASRIVDPGVTRHVALALPRTGEITPAIRVVIEQAQALARDLSTPALSGH
jgi:LysR family transcriptional regulator, nitrogen assimilation regulatory protein